MHKLETKDITKKRKKWKTKPTGTKWPAKTYISTESRPDTGRAEALAITVQP